MSVPTHAPVVPPPEGVALVRGGALGDFLLTLPVVQALLARGEAVAVVAPERYAPLIPEGARLHRGAWPWDPRAEPPFPRVRLGLACAPSAAEALRAAGVPEVRAVTPLPPPGVHASAHFGSLIGSAALPAPRVHAPARADVPEFPVCIAPGSGGRHKRWPLERWGEVHARLRARGVPVRWVAGPDEEDLAAWPVRPEAPTLPELTSLAAAAGAWLGPDAGPQHLARAVGCPTGVVFGPTDPGQWAPPGAQIWLWQTLPDTIASWAERQRGARAGGRAEAG